jgi:hypothetical protein
MSAEITFVPESESTVDVLETIEQAVTRVEEAVKNKWSTVNWIGTIVIGVFVWSGVADMWHSKWRYALTYGVSEDRVYVDNVKHDCAFLAAPLGEKYCHYDWTSSTLRWATSTYNLPIVSYDEGKTWSVFTPNATDTVPKHPTVEEVYVHLEKKDD